MRQNFSHIGSSSLNFGNRQRSSIDSSDACALLFNVEENKQIEDRGYETDYDNDINSPDQ